MKKFVFALAALAVALVSCTKGGEQEKDTTPARLLSFQILKADNAFLDKDYSAELIAPTMVIRIPGGGMDKSFTAVVKVGEFDKLYVNGAKVELQDATAKVQFQGKFAVDIEVVNEKSSKSAAYEVKIGKILQLVTKKLATLPASEGMVYTSSSYKTAVNPQTGELWVAYSFTPTGGKKNIGVKKYSNNAFVQVGQEGIVTGESTVAVASIYCFIFDASGTPYILYKAGDVSNLMSVRKFDGADWVLVGNAGFGQKQSSIGCGAQLYFDAAGNPGVVYTLDRRGTTSAYGNEICYLESNEWKSTVISGFPAYDAGTNAGLFYSGTAVKMNGKTYGFATANQYGMYVYELSGASWATKIVDNYKAEGEDFMNPGNFSLAIKDGKILMLGTLTKTKQDQLFLFDGQGFTPYGGTFDVSEGWLSSSTNSPSEAHMGVNPVTGQVVVIRTDENNYPKYSILNDNLQWEEFVYLGTTTTKEAEGNPVIEHDVPAAYGGTTALAFDNAGNILVIYPDDARGQSGFPLYSIGLEDDILPE